MERQTGLSSRFMKCRGHIVEIYLNVPCASITVGFSIIWSIAGHFSLHRALQLHNSLKLLIFCRMSVEGDTRSRSTGLAYNSRDEEPYLTDTRKLPFCLPSAIDDNLNKPQIPQDSLRMQLLCRTTRPVYPHRPATPRPSMLVRYPCLTRPQSLSKTFISTLTPHCTSLNRTCCKSLPFPWQLSGKSKPLPGITSK
jgi:hypothetical protein